MTKTIPPTPLAPGGSVPITGLVAADLAGALTLPQDVRRGIVSYNTLKAEVLALQGERSRWPLGWRQTARETVARSAARRMLSAPALDTDGLLGELAGIEAAGETFERRYDLARTAFEEAGRLLPAVAGQSVVVAAVAAGLAAVFTTVRALPPDAPMTAEGALDGAEGQRVAYRTLQTALGRYGALRAAMAELRRRFPCQRDSHGLFLDTPVGPELPMRHRILPVEPAGPSDPLARLLWLAREGRGWCPTASEQDEAFSAWLAASAEPKAA